MIYAILWNVRDGWPDVGAGMPRRYHHGEPKPESHRTLGSPPYPPRNTPIKGSIVVIVSSRHTAAMTSSTDPRKPP